MGDAWFWELVDKGPGPDDCWLWTGRRHTAGYGRLWYGGTDAGAHRVAWMLMHGAIPPDIQIMHRCGQRACVRPEHHFAATAAAAGQYKAEHDLMARGDRSGARRYPERWARGQRHGQAKLSDAQVAEIRARYAAKEAPITRLARDYRVGTSQIWRIVTGESRST
jgi:hypothetical protein